jgi:phosphonatase-like hydrolase
MRHFGRQAVNQPIKAVLFDVIGTTVREIHPDAINDCFEKAFTDNHVSVERSYLLANRGKDKKEVIQGIVQSLNLSTETSHHIYLDFEKNLSNSFENFTANAGALELFLYLREQNIKIGLGTGLPRSLFEGILRHLDWSADAFDYIGIASELGAGRPSPVMIHHFMKVVAINQGMHVLKVGDTLADIEEGKNGGVRTAVILSGTQPASQLQAARPDFIIHTLSELKNIIQ